MTEEELLQTLYSLRHDTLFAKCFGESGFNPVNDFILNNPTDWLYEKVKYTKQEMYTLRIFRIDGDYLYPVAEEEILKKIEKYKPKRSNGYTYNKPWKTDYKFRHPRYKKYLKTIDADEFINVAKKYQNRDRKKYYQSDPWQWSYSKLSVCKNKKDKLKLKKAWMKKTHHYIHKETNNLINLNEKELNSLYIREHDSLFSLILPAGPYIPITLFQGESREECEEYWKKLRKNRRKSDD